MGLLWNYSCTSAGHWLAVLSSLEEWRHPHLEARETRDVAILELVSKVAQRITLLAQAQLELTVRRFHMFLFIPFKELGSAFEHACSLNPASNSKAWMCMEHAHLLGCKQIIQH
jgi:hypothetical protein